MTKPKILVLDIETRPALAYVWRMFDENINHDQIIKGGGVICVGAQWIGERHVMFFSEWQHGQRGMLGEIHALISEADAVVSYNGDRFDLRKLNGEFLLAGMAPPPPPTSIDLWKTIRKMGFDLSRLAYIGPLLNVGRKIKHEGFMLWAKVMEGDQAAQVRMERYCKQDVRVTARLYRRILPFITNHPHLGEVGSTACGACGSHNVQKRGFRRTRSFKIQRMHCQSCGSWFEGTRKKVP